MKTMLTLSPQPLEDYLAGIVYGMALGDAMGMPGELWSRNRIQQELGYISEFLDGPANNEVACFYRAGQFTDDTAQALVILETLAANEYVPKPIKIAQALLVWAESEQAFSKNILGPTSKATLLAFRAGENTRIISDQATTNGAAMRIAPIGGLFPSNQATELADYVAIVSAATHTSAVSVSGAVLIAYAVSCALGTHAPKQAILQTLSLFPYAQTLGAEGYEASIAARVRMGIEYAERLAADETQFLTWVYEAIGTGVGASESVPAALLLAYYAEDPSHCARLAANLGGDTDTIGAMATAISGAAFGKSAIQPQQILSLEASNSIDFNHYIALIKAGRQKFSDA